jgi:hypothetical protein
MSNERKSPKMIFTVLLVGGKEIVHTYDIPPDRVKIEEFMSPLFEMIVRAMTRGLTMLLTFENPRIFYNPDNVLGIKFDTIEAEELEEAIERAQRKTGFIKD